MAMGKTFAAAAIALAFSACTAHQAPVAESSFCAGVTLAGWNSSSVVDALTRYADSEGLSRRSVEPNMALYANPGKDFLISMVVLHEGFAELAFYPRAPGIAERESRQFREFVERTLAKSHRVAPCEQIHGYRKGSLSGFDKIAI